MECKEVREKLVAFVDRELPAEVMRGIEQHIKGCPDCEREHRKVAKFTTSIVDLLEPLRPSRSFKESVLTTVTTHERRGIGPGPASSGGGWTDRLPERWLMVLLVGLITLAVVGAAILMLRPTVPVGKLVVEEGSAKVLEYGRGRWRAVADRREIFPGERVETSPGSRATVRLEGASVTLSGSTTVQIESTVDALRIHFATPGEMHVEANILREFQVVAQRVRVTWGRGSANVRLGSGGGVLVSACEGDLRIDDPGEKVQIHLAEGRELTVPQSGRPAREPREIPPERLEWLKRGPPEPEKKEHGASGEDPGPPDGLPPAKPD